MGGMIRNSNYGPNRNRDSDVFTYITESGHTELAQSHREHSSVGDSPDPAGLLLEVEHPVSSAEVQTKSAHDKLRRHRVDLDRNPATAEK